MLTAQSEIRPLLDKLWMDCDEILWRDLGWKGEQVMKTLVVIWITMPTVQSEIQSLLNMMLFSYELILMIQGQII